MAQLIDKYQDYVKTVITRTKEQDDDKAIRDAYNTAMGKAFEAPKTPSLGSAVDKFKAESNPLLGILQGLGEMGKYVQTKEGSNIIAGIGGLENNPFKAKYFSEQGEKAGASEAGLASEARSAEQGRLAQIGQDLRAKEALQSQATEGESDRILQSVIAQGQQNQSEASLAQEKALKMQEMAQRQQEFSQKPIEEQRKVIVDAAQEAFKKGTISAGALQEIIQNPDTKQIVNRGWWTHLVPFVKTSTVEDKPNKNYTIIPKGN